jgi:hypothetical protein
MFHKNVEEGCPRHIWLLEGHMTRIDSLLSSSQAWFQDCWRSLAVKVYSERDTKRLIFWSVWLMSLKVCISCHLSEKDRSRDLHASFRDYLFQSSVSTWCFLNTTIEFAVQLAPCVEMFTRMWNTLYIGSSAWRWESQSCCPMKRSKCHHSLILISFIHTDYSRPLAPRP